MIEYKNDDEIYVGEKETFELPPAGIHPVVCCDVVTYKKPATARSGEQYEQSWLILIFQVFPAGGSRQSDGRPFLLEQHFIASFNPSTNGNKYLRENLEDWRGRPFTKEEARKFNIAKLKGVNGLAEIERDYSARGNEYCRLVSLQPAPKHQNLIPENYTRRDYEFLNRPRRNNNHNQFATVTRQSQGVDDYVPF